MRVLIEGPKFSGKNKLSSTIASEYPGCSEFFIRCFFAPERVVDSMSGYLIPNDSVLGSLKSLAESFRSIPLTDDILVVRFHIFDWVQRSSHVNPTPVEWKRYEIIEQVLIEAGFRLIVLTPPFEELCRRARIARNQHPPIPLEVLREHVRYYHESLLWSHLPALQISDARFDCSEVLNWLKK